MACALRFAMRCADRVRGGPRCVASASVSRQVPRATAYSTLAACLDQSDARVAHVCAPTNQHFALCSQALEAGLHTLVEKPAASDALLTEQLLTLARDGNRFFGVSLQLRFQDGFRYLLRRRESLGDPIRVEFRAATAGGENLDQAGHRQLLWEILPHPLSVFAALFGATAWEADWHLDRADDQELELLAEIDGVRCSILLSLRERPRSLKLEWRGSEGRADVDFYHGYGAVHRGANTRSDKLGRPFIEAAVNLGQASSNLARRTLRREAAYPGLATLISQFYASLDGGPPPLSAEEILGIARIAASIRNQTAA